MTERFRDVAQQAEWLGVSTKTIRRYACAMGGAKVGSRLVFSETKTLAWLETRSLAPRRRAVKAVR